MSECVKYISKRKCQLFLFWGAFSPIFYMSATEAGHDFGGLKIEYRALGPLTNVAFVDEVIGKFFFYQKNGFVNIFLPLCQKFSARRKYSTFNFRR